MGLCIKETYKYGRGVYATRDYKSGELIECSPVIIAFQHERKYIKKTQLSDYFFNWGENYDHCAIALGYGSLFNHSYTPNSTFENNVNHLTIDFYALTDIKSGEEITINYNGDPDDSTELWFEVYD